MKADGLSKKLKSSYFVCGEYVFVLIKDFVHILTIHISAIVPAEISITIVLVNPSVLALIMSDFLSSSTEHNW